MRISNSEKKDAGNHFELMDEKTGSFFSSSHCSCT
jgi:hypothetical protein